MFDAQELAERYLAVWNEADPERRRIQIASLWVPEGRHYVDVREAVGYAALEQRIAGSFNKNVRDGRHRFRAVGNARTLHDIVVFDWEMRRTADDTAAARGFVVLRVNAGGQILTDYQFMV